MKYHVRTNYRGEWSEHDYADVAELMSDLRERDQVVKAGERDAQLQITAYDSEGELAWSAHCGSMQTITPRVQAARLVWAIDASRACDEAEAADDEYGELRIDVLEALTAYVEERRAPGQFLRAVLENDLVGAYSRADETSERTLGALVRYCLNRIPHGVWGSPDAVRRHLRRE